MWWFTEDDGVLCLGTEPHGLATIVIETDIVLGEPVERLATDDERSMIGNIQTANTETVCRVAKRVNWS